VVNNFASPPYAQRLISVNNMQGGSSWLYIYPQGFRDLLLYIKKYYGNPTIYITENGTDPGTILYTPC
jgi:beta-glucosidase/6-phospho-beta-glucosidase/beta-galactosidase